MLSACNSILILEGCRIIEMEQERVKSITGRVIQGGFHMRTYSVRGLSGRDRSSPDRPVVWIWFGLLHRVSAWVVKFIVNGEFTISLHQSDLNTGYNAPKSFFTQMIGTKYQKWGLLHQYTFRGDTMILPFDVPPLASRQGLCDIEKKLFGVTQKKFKNWQVLAGWNKTNNSSFPIWLKIGLIPPC